MMKGMMNSIGSKLSSAYTFLVMVFLYAPILVLIVFSFNSTKSRSTWTGFSLHWYEELLQNRAIAEALAATLLVALAAAVFSTVIGTLGAIGIHSLGSRSKALLMNVTYIPLVSPEIIMGVSLMLLFSLVGIEFGITSLILAHITFNLPYVILSVLPKLRQMDKHLFEAALDLGCNQRQAFAKVVLPEIMPGIVTGFLMSITFSLDDFNVSYFVSGDKFQTLPVLIYSMTRRRVSPEINALSTLMFLAVLVILLTVNIRDAIKEKKLLKEMYTR